MRSWLIVALTWGFFQNGMYANAWKPGTTDNTEEQTGHRARVVREFKPSGRTDATLSLNANHLQCESWLGNYNSKKTEIHLTTIVPGFDTRWLSNNLTDIQNKRSIAPRFWFYYQNSGTKTNAAKDYTYVNAMAGGYWNEGTVCLGVYLASVTELRFFIVTALNG